MANIIDVFDEENRRTGKASTINSALRKGLWMRGAHVVVHTKTGYVVVQKRSRNMIMHPGYLDFSAGGVVDSGETPEQAAVRELREETGISISRKDLNFIDIQRNNHYWPKLHKKNRTFSYLYSVTLPTHGGFLLTPQESEVEWVRFVPMKQVRSLVRRHRIKRLGRIEPHYRLYRRLLAAIESH